LKDPLLKQGGTVLFPTSGTNKVYPKNLIVDKVSNKINIRRTLATVLDTLSHIANAFAQPEISIDEWSGKIILFIGAHPDEDSEFS
jgi:hypothetical protein